MKILVDADACPVKDSIVKLAKRYEVPVVMVIDNTHILSYAETFVTVITVDKGADSADLASANRTEAGDICITGDYGLASLLLAKKGLVLHPNGFSYTLDNIDRMLFERHISREMRRKKKGYGGHIAKRTKVQDEAFYQLLEQKLKTVSLGE